MLAVLSYVLASAVALLGVAWFFLRQSRPADSSPQPLHQASDATTEETSDDSFALRTCPVSGAGGHGKDPIEQFADGEKKTAPLMCPFMAAFQSAQNKKRYEADEGAEEEEREDEALTQFKEFMDGYQIFKEKKEEQRKEEEKQQKDEDDLETGCNTMVAHIKRLEQEKMILQLTEEEMEAEKEARQAQLAEIYALMQEQQDKFGINNVTEMQKQMRLYVT